MRLQSPHNKRTSGSTVTLSTQSLHHTLVVVDAGVDDYQQLVSGVIPGVQVLVLDPTQDGMKQITQVLKAYGNITMLHIVAHGAPGCLSLGNTQLSLDTIDRYAWDLTSWFPVSSSTPSILLYACRVAAGIGTTFLEKLRHLTEASIAASSTPIGNAEQGGNWELDVITGVVESLPIFQPHVLDSYSSIFNSTYHQLSTGAFAQNWSDPELITANHDWSSVPSIIGYRGDALTAGIGTDPQTIVADGTTTLVNVTADRPNPNTFTTGGIAEFAITDPTIAMQGSGTADAPFLLIHLDATGVSNVQISYTLRDIDGSADNAVSQVALQYRIGEVGDFINLPTGYVADASTGPNLATQITSVIATLPSAANNQSKVQIRVITTNATGEDEWIGIDDINVTSGGGNQAPILVDNAVLAAIPEDVGSATNTGGKITDLISGLSTDADGDPQAIAVTGVDNSNGTWQYSTNGGTTWIDFSGTLADNNAVILGATSLYNAPIGTAPASQGWLSFTNISGATQTANSNGTVLDTTANNGIYAGYSNFNGATLVNPNFPTLDNVAGYSISFNLQMLAESRTNPSRAGFSIVVVSNDQTKAIELGFQQLSATTGNIFAQSQSPIFTAAESVSFNTNLATDYTLKVEGNSYKLFANGTEVLTGSLRDYSGFAGFPDPYETPNFVFLGDDTTSAQGRFNLSQVVVQTDTRVRFVPNPNYNGTADITFRAWDTTNGLANGDISVNASTNGGSTAYSATASIASITVNPANDVPMGEVTVVGTAQANQTLTADSSGLSDADGLGTLSYKWQVYDGTTWADIPAAVEAMFTLDNQQVGKTVRVEVSYTDQQGTPEIVYSAATNVITNDNNTKINNSPTGTVTITGTAQENQILTANTSSLSDADGLETFNYQWQASNDGVTWTDISRATDSSFTLGNAQTGQFVRVKVAYTDGQGTNETVDSVPTTAITGINAPTPFSPTLRNDTGISQQDRVTSANQPNFGGTGEPGREIRVFAGQTRLGTALIDAAGNWDFTAPNPLLDGTYELFFTATNPSGDASNASAKLDLTIDTMPPTAVIVEMGSAIRETSPDAVTIRFSEAVSNFEVSDLLLTHDGNLVSLTQATLTTTDNITWTLSNLSPSTKVDGDYQLTLKQNDITDTAGNKLSAEVVGSWLLGRTGMPLPPIVFKNGKASGIHRTGNRSNDRLIGTPFNDVLKGGKGNDLIISGFGKAQFGIDRLHGDDGNDRLISGKGNDILNGGRGHDWIKAGQGHDLLLGGDGNDQLIGNAGRDVIIGGMGRDRLTGGSGSDTFVYSSLDQTDTITDFNSDDLLDLRSIFAQPGFDGENAFVRFLKFVKLEQIGTDVNVKVDTDGNGMEKKFNSLAILQNITINETKPRNFLIA